MSSQDNLTPVEKRFFWLITAVLAFAYTSHISFYPINVGTDEGIRALVSLEMMLSGDYITPTLNGELYLNKPPLFNWILAASFKLFGYNSFALRFPTVLSIFIFGFLVFYFTRKYVNAKVAWVSAIAVMTNGRILIYDSVLGLIDITYAWVTFLGFMLVFHFGEKKQYSRLFISTYIITAAGFLLKGFPSVAFHGLTLLSYFIYTKNFRKLFHWNHFAGIIVFLAITGAYYLMYFSRNNLPPPVLFKNLLTESSKRLTSSGDTGRFLFHVLGFPFYILYHFAPLTLLGVLLFRKKLIDSLRSNPYIFFCAAVFMSNIIVYWVSPNIFARYLFMLIALLFIVLSFFYIEAVSEIKHGKKIIDTVFLSGAILLLVSCFFLPFTDSTSLVQHVWPRSIFLIICFGVVVWLMLKNPGMRIIHFFLAMALFRIGFNWFVIEQRGKENMIAREDGKKIAIITQGKPLCIFGRPLDIYESGIGDKNATSFNIAIHRKEVIRFKPGIDYNSFYLTNPAEVKNIPHEVYYEFNNPGTDKAILIKFVPPVNQPVKNNP
ncbi:MAG: glycosyltransferase family 39 protein [Chitinophagaceae bacterium]|nr:glycosyltransferase family 39 protein [Chitinophagaceae bacterium]